MFVVVEMWDMYVLLKLKLFEKENKNEYVWLFLSWLFICVLILHTAAALPSSEMVIGIVGKVRGILVAIVLLIHFYLQIKNKSITKWSKILHWTMIIIATLMRLAGAGFTCYKICESYENSVLYWVDCWSKKKRSTTFH